MHNSCIIKLPCRYVSPIVCDRIYGATYHDVESAECRDRLVDHVLNACLLAHVGLDGDRLDVRVPFVNQLVGLLHGLLVHVDKRDVRAFQRKEQRAFETDAAVIAYLSQYGTGGLQTRHLTIPRR